MTTSTSDTLDALVQGDGPGLVLLHGTGADAAINSGPLLAWAGDGRRVVAPNLPGAGATPVPTEPLTVSGLVTRILTTVDAAGVEDFDLVGHSLGGVLALAVAVAAPDRVRSLVVHAAWVRTGPRERLQFDLWGRLLAADPRLLARTLVLSAMSADHLDSIPAADLDAMVDGFEAMVDDRIAAQIDLDGRIDLDGVERITAPTLVLASSDDRIVATHHQQAIAAAIAGARYVGLTGGHAAPFEASDAFTGAIAGFLTDAPAVTSR